MAITKVNMVMIRIALNNRVGELDHCYWSGHEDKMQTGVAARLARELENSWRHLNPGDTITIMEVE